MSLSWCMISEIFMIGLPALPTQVTWMMTVHLQHTLADHICRQQQCSDSECRHSWTIYWMCRWVSVSSLTAVNKQPAVLAHIFAEQWISSLTSQRYISDHDSELESNKTLKIVSFNSVDKSTMHSDCSHSALHSVTNLYSVISGVWLSSRSWAVWNLHTLYHLKWQILEIAVCDCKEFKKEVFKAQDKEVVIFSVIIVSLELDSTWMKCSWSICLRLSQTASYVRGWRCCNRNIKVK